jgi:hypothetical protein
MPEVTQSTTETIAASFAEHLPERVQDVSWLGQGKSNNSYLVSTDEGYRVARLPVAEVSHTGERAIDKLTREHVHYRFLEEQSIQFAPRSLFFDERRTLHCVSFVPGRDVRFSGLDDVLTDRFMDHVIALYDMSYGAYEELCQRYGYTPDVSTEDMSDSVEQYAAQPLQRLQQSALDKDALHWMQQRLERNRELIANRDTSCETQAFTWGDLSENMRARDDTLTFIDGERSRWMMVRPGVGYLVSHGPFRDRRQFEHTVRRQAAYFGVDVAHSEENTALEVANVLLNDVVWAAARTADTSDGDSDRYRELMRKRMRAMEQFEQVWQSGTRQELIEFYISHGWS